MAHFIGFLQGNRGEASRLGTKDSGISASARGWDAGGSIEGFHDKETQKDFFRVYADKGSNYHDSKPIATIRELSNHKIEVVLINPLTRKEVLKIEV